MDYAQNRYYQELYEIKALEIFYSKLFESYSVLNKWSTVVLTSITLIMLAIQIACPRQSFIFSFVLIAIQIITLIFSIFNGFEEKLKIIGKLADKLAKLFVRMEKDWKKVANGTLTSDEINDLWYLYRKKRLYIDENFGVVIGGKKITKEVYNEADVYFSKFFYRSDNDVQRTKNQT